MTNGLSQHLWAIGTCSCVLLLGAACGGGNQGGDDGGDDVRDLDAGGTGVKVDPAPNADAYAGAKAALAADTPKDATAFLARWRPSYLAKLPYDPSQAVNLPLIQSSSLKLSDAELATLASSGLAISARQSFPTFFMGYLGIYASDLPLFVSGDSVLHAVHRSYDAILKDVELAALQPTLQTLITGMRNALVSESSAGSWPSDAVADVDAYLAIALSLSMATGRAAPVAGGDDATISAIVAKVMSGTGSDSITLFGESRVVDFSQFAPRGHYAGSSLESYFRAMMWLGRMDLRLLSQDASGRVTFDRRQFIAAALLAKLVAPVATQWSALDSTLRAFVGESDNMTPSDFSTLLASLGADSWQTALAMSDDALAEAIIAGGFGIQRIASQLLFVAPGNEGAPLDRAFLVLGQRFAIDSQVLSNVVYDRVADKPYRMMPNPLDVAFAALGNSGAADFLTDDLQAHPGYPQALHQARVLVDAHEPGYFAESLYTSWLGALRAASPDWSPSAGTPAQPIFATKPWTQRILQLQLASWAELRHDTILYTKQSYTGIPTCEYPDAYVEPIPALWHAIGEFANRGAALVAGLGVGSLGPGSAPAKYFASLAGSAAMLESMAQAQQDGQPFTADQMAFINQAVEYRNESVVCATIRRPTGWYPQLFYNPDDSSQQNTVIVDVHTQPADEQGDMVGKVLHVGTGYPRLMVVTFNTCSGPRAYVGVVSAYHETITENFDRLTDERWTAQIASTPPAEVPWIADLVSP
jgi:hypothetical protein